LRLVTTAYRAHNPRWSFKPESGDGAAKSGGRFNPVGVPALYTSLRLQTAWLEAQQGFVFKAQPMMLCAYDVDCEGILDLTSPQTLEQHGIAEADIACAWKDLATRGETPPSWHMTRRLIADGVAGIITRSFAAGSGGADINVVFWRWSPELPHRVRVVDDAQRLPKDARSWL
jgi:RES domain-containing protein